MCHNCHGNDKEVYTSARIVLREQWLVTCLVHSLIFELMATSEKRVAYLLSRSRIKYFGPLCHAVASRSCWAVHSSVGCFVTRAWMTFLVFSSITINTYHCRNNQS